MTLFEHPRRSSAEIAWYAFAAFLVLHGIAHLAGTANSFRYAEEGKAADYLGGLWTISDPSVLRAVGAAWILPALAFLVAAWAIWSGARWQLTALVEAAVLSLVLSIVALWAAIVGVVIDVLLLFFAAWIGTHGRGSALGGRDGRGTR